jgi:hypothetical protein
MLLYSLNNKTVVRPNTFARNSENVKQDINATTISNPESRGYFHSMYITGLDMAVLNFGAAL